MAKTSPNTRKLAAGVAAVVLTLGAAGAAVAVNLGTGGSVDTPAGKLSATEPVSTDQSTTQVTPSTIYVDLTVPVTAPGSGSGTPSTSNGSNSAGSNSAGSSSTGSSGTSSYSDDDSDHADDHGGDHDDGADHDDGDDHGGSRYEEGHDDDD